MFGNILRAKNVRWVRDIPSIVQSHKVIGVLGQETAATKDNSAAAMLTKNNKVDTE